MALSIERRQHYRPDPGLSPVLNIVGPAGISHTVVDECPGAKVTRWTVDGIVAEQLSMPTEKPSGA